MGRVVFLLVLCFFLKKVFLRGLLLTSIPELSDDFSTICPGMITFTCTGDGPSLTWVINGTHQETYTYRQSDILPLSMGTRIPGVQIQVISARHHNDFMSINITSTLSGPASNLKGLPIQCVSSMGWSRTLTIGHVGAPPSISSSIICSLIIRGSPEVIIEWSPSFTSRYNVQMYRVVVTPITPSCSSSQQIRASEGGFRCPEMARGVHYYFTISAINCWNQEGTRDTFTVKPQVPETPDTAIIYEYDQNRGERNLRVQWIEHISQKMCRFNPPHHYRVDLLDITGVNLYQMMFNQDDCSDDLCSAVFPLHSTSQSHHVKIGIGNSFGSSMSEISVAPFPSYVFSLSLENCGISYLCNFPGGGRCLMRYGNDPSYQNLSPTVATPINVPLSLYISEASTLFYYQATINTTSSHHIQIRGNFTTRTAPPSTSASCSIATTRGGPEVTIQWSPSFTSQYDVEMYRVVVNPATPSCLSDQILAPSEDYVCSGLVFGTLYVFTVNVIKCHSQEGPKDTFKLQPQRPETPSITLLNVYIRDQTRQVNQLIVEWTQPDIVSMWCSFIHEHTIVLEDSERRIVEQRVVNSESCSDNICSIIFLLPITDQKYYVSISTTNIFGSSQIAKSQIDISIPSTNNISSADNCITLINCNTPLADVRCSIQLSLDPLYQNLSRTRGPMLYVPLTSVILYYQIVTGTHQFRGNFTTGFWVSSPQIGLLLVGVALLCAAIAMSVILVYFLLKVIKRESCPSLAFLVISGIIIIISVMLWVAVVIHVAMQKSTEICDRNRQSVRNDLIITAHVFSDISFLVVGLVAAFLLYSYRTGHYDYLATELRDLLKEYFGSWFSKRKRSQERSLEGVSQDEHELISLYCFHDISDQEAQELLQPHTWQDGHFLLRPSSRKGVLCTICVTNQLKVVHYHLFKDQYRRLYRDEYYILSGRHFPSITALLSHYQNKPINVNLNTCLRYPVVNLKLETNEEPP